MKESQNNTEAVRSFNYYGYKAYKLSDVRGSRFTETKPCDMIICSPKGRYISVESKLMKKWTRFNDSELRPNQIAHLDATVKREGRAFVFLFVSIPANKAKGQKRVRKLCVLDWKIHRKFLRNKGYDINLIRRNLVGVWLDPIKDDEGKIMWNLKNLLSPNFGK